MTEILRFLVAHCSFLYAAGRFRFVDSQTVRSFGDAYVVMASESVRLRFVRERGQIVLDFQPLDAVDESHWFSIDVVHGVLTGERLKTATKRPRPCLP